MQNHFNNIHAHEMSPTHTLAHESGPVQSSSYNILAVSPEDLNFFQQDEDDPGELAEAIKKKEKSLPPLGQAVRQLIYNALSSSDDDESLNPQTDFVFTAVLPSFQEQDSKQVAPHTLLSECVSKKMDIQERKRTTRDIFHKLVRELNNTGGGTSMVISEENPLMLIVEAVPKRVQNKSV